MGKKKMNKTKFQNLLSENNVIPMVLPILTGIVRGHKKSQNLAFELKVIPILHSMENTSTSNAVGPKSELLLESLSKNNKKISNKINKLRNKTKDKKKKKQLAFRNKMLSQINKNKKVNKNESKLIIKLEDEPSEKIRCMICKEGYYLRPNDLLGIYVNNKDLQTNDISLTQFDCLQNEEISNNLNQNDPFSTATMCCFNLVHFTCHRAAVRADHSAKKQKKEWEGAKLRNSGCDCNNLLPIKSTHKNM